MRRPAGYDPGQALQGGVSAFCGSKKNASLPKTQDLSAPERVGACGPRIAGWRGHGERDSIPSEHAFLERQDQAAKPIFTVGVADEILGL